MILMPFCEVADRYTIARLKFERLGEEGESFREQMHYYESGLPSGCSKFAELTEKLYTVNGQIWDTEAEIRAGTEAAMTLEEVGCKALRVRDLNRKRNGVKNEIAELAGGFKDCKVNYA